MSLGIAGILAILEICQHVLIKAEREDLELMQTAITAFAESMARE